jgi:hypothetical protein
LGNYWWIFAPVLLIFASLESWLFFVRQRYLLSIKWVLLEVKPPSDVQKSPKIAENIFSGLHGVYSKPINWRKTFLKGEVQKWFSFEIVGTGGDIHFYVRTPEDLRNLVESQIFAQYGDAEIKVVDDYVDDMPKYLPNEEYNLFGTELVFTKEDAYPIKTYPFFEEESGKDEFKRTDPLAPIAEIMSSLQPGEHIWLQLVLRPTGGDWVKDAQKTVDKLIGKPEPKPDRGLLGAAFDVVDEAIGFAPAVAEEKKKEEASLAKLTPGQKFVLEQVENKMAKLGFKTGYRFVYLGRSDGFRMSTIASVIGHFKQLYSNNLNSFKPNGDTITSGSGILPWLTLSGDGFFSKQDEFKKKWQLYQDYRKRNFVKKVIVLNTEELATLWHLPGIGVKAPSFPRVEVRKGQPPIGLPTRESTE